MAYQANQSIFINFTVLPLGKYGWQQRKIFVISTRYATDYLWKFSEFEFYINTSLFYVHLMTSIYITRKLGPHVRHPFGLLIDKFGCPRLHLRCPLGSSLDAILVLPLCAHYKYLFSKINGLEESSLAMFQHYEPTPPAQSLGKSLRDLTDSETREVNPNLL